MIGLGLPLALITGWLVAQSLNQAPKANQQINHQLQSRVKPVEHPHKTKAPQTIEPEQKLEQLALSHPREWRWRLLLAQMKLQRGDRNGAGRELITLQALWPNRSEVQNLQLILDMGNRQATALEQTSDRFKQAPKGQRLSLGLRLADLQRLSGQDIAAIATYRLIATESPESMQPLLALALLHRDMGQRQLSQKVLLSVRNRLSVNKQDKQALDQLAVRWQLDSFRKREDRTPTRRATVLPPPPKARVETIPKP